MTDTKTDQNGQPLEAEDDSETGDARPAVDASAAGEPEGGDGQENSDTARMADADIDDTSTVIEDKQVTDHHMDQRLEKAGKPNGQLASRRNIIDFMPHSPEARQILEERAMSLRTRDGAGGLDEIGAKKGEPYIRFFLGPKKRFGILHIQTEKVLENAHVTRVPGVPDHIVGIMNYRGNLLTVLSLRSLLALGKEESQEDKQIIVARLDDLKVGFLVDSIEGEGRLVRENINVRDVSNMGGETRGIIGIADGTVAILDLERLMSKPGIFVDMSA